MKYCSIVGLLLLGCAVGYGDISEDDFDRLEDMEIAGVRDDTEKDDDRNKIEVLEVNTFQNLDDQGTGFRLHTVIILKDKAKNLYRVNFKGNRPDNIDSEYTGEDYWFVYMPHGELERLSVDAFVVQYGFMDGEEFVLFAEDTDGVKTMEEILAIEAQDFPSKVRMKHYYMYEEDEDGEVESISTSVREVIDRKKS